jgi:hypothetical protein
LDVPLSIVTHVTCLGTVVLPVWSISDASGFKQYRFEQQGLVVHPVATDHEVGSPNARMDWLPDANALDGSALAFKEMVGYWQQEAVAPWFRRH